MTLPLSGISPSTRRVLYRKRTSLPQISWAFERAFLINKPFHSFIQRELQDRFYLYLQGVLGSPLKQTCELVLKKKDGTSFNAQLDSTAVNAGGHKTVKAVLTDITARKSMEQSLKDSETRYRLLFEQSPDSIVIIDPATARPLEFNETAHLQLGYSREEFATLSISDFEALETPEDTQKRIANVMREGRSDFETKHRTRQGEIRNIHVTAQLTEIQGRTVYHCIWRDITDRKLAEEALRDRQKELQTIMDAAPMAITWSDMEGNIQYINNAFHKLFGYTLEDIPTTEDFRRLAYPLTADLEAYTARVLEQKKRLEQGEEAIPIEVALTCKDGSMRHVEALGTVVSNKRMVIYTDITDRKLVEDRLRESEAFLNTLLNTIPIPVFYKDNTGAYLGFNKAFETFFGTTKEYLVGKSVSDINPPELAQVYQSKDKEIFASKGTQQYEAQVRNTQGSLRDVVFNKAVFTDGQGDVGGLVGTILDITERKRTEEQLREREEMMRYMIQHDPNAIAVL